MLDFASADCRHGCSSLACRMTDERPPEPRETRAPGPFIDQGEVTVFALGGDRFRITWPGSEREVEGFEHAMRVADELAR
jgi:hypothetical protein